MNQVDKILKYFIYTGLFLILLVPVVIWESSFFPFITGKNFIFRILVGLITGAWLILAMRNASYRPRFSWVLGAVLIFAGSLGLSTIFSEYPYKSFWSNFERMEGYITTLHLAVYFIVAGAMLNTEKLWSRFLHSSVAVSVYIGIYGLLQLAGKITINQGGVRLDGTLGNASYLAVYMLVNFFIVLFLFARRRNFDWLKWIYSLVALLQLYVLFYTATRGAILGLIVGVIVTTALILILARGWPVMRKVALATFVLVVLFVGTFAFLKDSGFVKNNPTLTRLTSITVSEAGPRFMVWNMAWQGFKERPILGWGQESFNYVFNKYYDPGMLAQEQWFDRTHNVLFDWLTAGGLLGLLAYLYMLIAALYYIWKQGDLSFSLKKCLSRFVFFWKKKEEDIPYLLEKSVLTGLLSAYFFQNLFVFDNITSYILYFTVLAYAHSMSAWPIKRLSADKFLTDKSTVNRIFVPIMAVAALFAVYFFNVAPIRTSTTLIDSIRPYQEGVAKNLEYFKKALAYESFGTPEIREQLAQKSLEVIYAQSIDLALRQEFYDLAKDELEEQTKQTPNDARYHLFLGSFLNRVRSYDEGIASLEKALSLSPNKQTILFELGTAYLNKGDGVKALEVLKKAHELDTRFSEPRVIYAVAAVYAGNYDLAEEIMSPVATSSAYYDDRLIGAYTSTGRHTKASELLAKKVTDQPENYQAAFALALSYFDAGSPQKSLQVLNKILAEFPDQKEQANTYMQKIRAGERP